MPIFDDIKKGLTKVAYDLGIIDKPKIYYVRYTGNKFNNKQAALADIKRYNSDIVYRYKSKQARFDRKNPIKNYTIKPLGKRYTLTNAGKATGAYVTYNQLDSIYNNAKKAGLPFNQALGLGIKESTLGNRTTDLANRAKLNKISKDIYYRAIRENRPIMYQSHFDHPITEIDLVNYQNTNINNPYYEALKYAEKQAKGNKLKYYQMLQQGEKYADNKARKFLEDTPSMSVLEAAFRKYKNNPNRYNPGQSNYSTLVNENAKAIMNSPEIINYLKTK